MARTESMLVSWMPVGPRSCRLDLVDFLVRMWRLNAWPRLTLPLPRTRRRFFAPDLVFIFGMTPFLLFAAHGGALLRTRLRRRCRRGFVATGFTGGLTSLGLVLVMLVRLRLGRLRLLHLHFLRGQQHHHLPAFHAGKRFDDAVRLQIGLDALEQPHPELLVRHLAPAEAQRDLRLVAFAQELDQVTKLDLVIAFVGARPELDFLDLDLLQLELGFMLLLALPVLELAVIHDPADRGFGHRGDLDQVEFGRLGFRQRLRERNDAKLLTFHTYESNLRRVDLAVESLMLLVESYVTSFMGRQKTAMPPPPRRARLRMLRCKSSTSDAPRPPAGSAPARRPGDGPRDPRRRGYARPPISPAAPYRRRSSDREAFAGYVPEFYRLFSRFANRRRRVIRRPSA